MSKADTARKNYEVARAELLERIRLRDQVLLVYLGIIGTIAGIALGTSAKREILLIIPFIGFGCSILVSQHNAVIGALIRFAYVDIRSFLKELAEEEYAPIFVCSDSFRKHSSTSNKLRSIGHSVIIVGPIFFALAYTGDYALGDKLPKASLWWAGAFLMVVSIGVIWYIHKERQRVYSETKWDESSESEQIASGRD
jgi:hypothetical protein